MPEFSEESREPVAPPTKPSAATPVESATEDLFNKMVDLEYSKFRRFLRPLKRHGITVDTKRGKGSHILLMNGKRIATISKWARKGNERLTPSDAKDILADLGISLSEALAWLTERHGAARMIKGNRKNPKR
jgi:hypothetical protein